MSISTLHLNLHYKLPSEDTLRDYPGFDIASTIPTSYWKMPTLEIEIRYGVIIYIFNNNFHNSTLSQISKDLSALMTDKSLLNLTIRFVSIEWSSETIGTGVYLVLRPYLFRYNAQFLSSNLHYPR